MPQPPPTSNHSGANPTGTPPPVGRRVFHLLAASSTALLSLAIPEHPYMLIIGGGALLSLAMEASRLRVGWMNRLFMLLFASILKRSEVAEISGATWFLIAAFFTFYFYGPAVALPTLLFVAVGDPAAALVGTHFPGPRIRGQIAQRRRSFRGRCPGGCGRRRALSDSGNGRGLSSSRRWSPPWWNWRRYPWMTTSPYR